MGLDAAPRERASRRRAQPADGPAAPAPARGRRAWRIGLRAVAWAALALLAAGLIAIALAVQGAPRWPAVGTVSPADVARARDFLRLNDPRRPAAGPLRTLVATEGEANLMLGQVARRLAPDASAQLRLGAGTARLQASLRLPHSPVAAWLNVEATLSETPGLPAVDALRLGRLPVPGWLAESLLPRLAGRLAAATPEAALALDMVRRVRLSPTRLVVVYDWGDDGLQRLLGSLLPPAEQARLTAYAQALAGAMQAHAGAGAGPGLPLDRLLPPLFTLASQRSAGGGDALAENRAALLTLALQASGRRLSELVPAVRAAPLPPLTLTLAGREDFAQHFLISAVLALEGGGPLADAIGVYKETADLRQGSGFSFNDIAADRAGTRLGLLARRAPLALQERLSRGARESDFMPEVADLPEFLGRKEFLATYGGLDAPAYRRMLADIERRLDALPLLRAP